MKITHQYKNTKIQKDSDRNTGLILGNNFGNYFYLTNGDETRYQGFFYTDGKKDKNELAVYKTIDQINILGTSKITEIKNSFFEVERKYDNNLSEKYFMPDGYNSLCVKTNKKARAEIILDMRYPYDLRKMGRIYDIEIRRDYALVKFTKQRDLNEDGINGKKEYTLYLAIKTDRYNYEKIGEFFFKHYKKDEDRNSYPYDRFVFKGLEIEFENAVFSVADTRQKALDEAKYISDNFEKLREKTKCDIYEKIKFKNIGDKEIEMAYLCAKNSINTLLVKNNNKKGAYAGLPWFFQFWHRDEAISILQIYKLNKNLAQEIILSQLERISDDGQILKRRFYGDEAEKLHSADALGWLANEIFKISANYKLAKDFEMDIVKGFEKAVSNLIQGKTINDLADGSKNETWMDTLNRNGARIEIQAGRLRIYNFLHKLTKNDQYKILEKELKLEVKKNFYKNKILFDGPEDETIRPNIFLAAYLYPKLLSKKEWELCFDKILPKLYLDWGGLSSIDITSDEFISKDTGENSVSYHNGNSWYWVNNLTALVLYRLNPDKYSKYINSIMEASTNEILYCGMVGHHSEVSSAEKQTSSGCEAQLWSNAIYLEVLDEIMKS
jgi:glycogen debranching enzyme